MAATVKIFRLTGAGKTAHDISANASNTSRAGAADADTENTDTSVPVKIPDAGSDTNNSYWVNTCLKVTGGDWEEIQNIKWYTDGGGTLTAAGAGISGIVGYTHYANYAVATGNTDGGTLLTTGSYGTNVLSGLSQNMFAYTSSNMLSGVNTGQDLGPTWSATSSQWVIDSGVSTDNASNIVVYQLKIYPEATAGATGTSTITWQYDEI